MRFNASKWASRNNLFWNLMNKLLNKCDIDPYCYVPKSIDLRHSGQNIIIGRGVKLGENLIIYHNVTLGTKDINNRFSDDYPIIEDNVIIGNGVTILGKVIIGESSVIGSESFIDKDIPRNSVVYNKKEIIIKNRK